MSFYLSPYAVGRGTGSRLLSALLDALPRLGKHFAVAGTTVQGLAFNNAGICYARLGQFGRAVAAQQEAIRIQEQERRQNYAQALEFSGQLQEALAQYQLGSIMSGDLPWMRALEGTCLAKLGRAAEAHAILDELEHRRETDYADALYMAVLRNALGEQAEAFKEIERAVDENSAFLYSIDVDPKMDVFRSDRRFTRIRDALKI